MEIAENRHPSRVQFAFIEVKIREATNDLSTTGIIKPSDAEHYCQVILVLKPDTTPSDASGIQSWPLPNTSNMFDRIGTKKARVFSIINSTQGFHQIALTPEAKRASAFITYNNVRQYSRLLFGMKGGPS